MDSLIWRPNYWISVGRWKEERQDRTGGLKGTNYSKINQYKIDEQQRYIVQHREMQPLFWKNFKGSIVYKNIESLWYTHDTNIMQINYTLIKNKLINLKNIARVYVKQVTAYVYFIQKLYGFKSFI